MDRGVTSSSLWPLVSIKLSHDDAKGEAVTSHEKTITDSNKLNDENPRRPQPSYKEEKKTTTTSSQIHVTISVSHHSFSMSRIDGSPSTRVSIRKLKNLTSLDTADSRSIYRSLADMFDAISYNRGKRLTDNRKITYLDVFSFNYLMLPLCRCFIFFLLTPFLFILFTYLSDILLRFLLWSHTFVF